MGQALRSPSKFPGVEHKTDSTYIRHHETSITPYDTYCVIVPDVFDSDECKCFIAETENFGYYSMGLDIPSKCGSYDSCIANELFYRLRHVLPMKFQGHDVTRINNYLRFLRYEHWQTFPMHTDTPYLTPDGKEASMISLTLFLNDDYGGGAVMFGDRLDRQYECKPRTGSVLLSVHSISRQEMDVFNGTKYTMRTDVMYETGE